MAIREYVDTHQVFTLAEFTRAFPHSVTDQNLLARAIRSGSVDRVRRGVYVSKAGQFAHSTASPFDVSAAVAEDAVFCYLSALHLHGILHNIVTVTQFYTVRHLDPFTYDGHAYQPRHRPKHHIDTQALLTVSGYRYQTTTKEQTLVDCLTRPALAGGPENVLRSLSGLVYFDQKKLFTLSESASGNTRAKLGWVLDTKREEWGIDSSSLERLADSVSGGPYYFWSSRPPKDSHWVNRWRLYLPYPEQEMTLWLNQ